MRRSLAMLVSRLLWLGWVWLLSRVGLRPWGLFGLLEVAVFAVACVVFGVVGGVVWVVA